jgi:hypothetical protein
MSDGSEVGVTRLSVKFKCLAVKDGWVLGAKTTAGGSLKDVPAGVKVLSRGMWFRAEVVGSVKRGEEFAIVMEFQPVKAEESAPDEMEADEVL